MLLKLKIVELEKELRTRALETHGSKYQLIARLSEYLDKAIKSNESGAPSCNPRLSVGSNKAANTAAQAVATEVLVHRSELDWLDPWRGGRRVI